MDYSTLPQDPDPEESSPWATSPRPNNTKSISRERPSSPSPVINQSAYQGTTYNDSDQNGDLDDTHSHAPINSSNGHADSEGFPHREQIHAQPDTHYQRGPDPRQIQQRHHDNRSAPRQTNAPVYKLQAKVTGLERTGRKDLILRFDIYTNLPGFRTTQFRDVRRSHSEFIKLAEHLISATPEAMVPAVPPSSTPAGVGTDEDEARVKAMMQRWMNCVCGNEVLMRDDEIIRFIEGDPGYSPVIKRSQPATGVRRKMLKQFAPPPDDTPELQEARPVVKLFYLGAMDAGQKVDKAVKARRGLGLAESDFGSKLSAMTEPEMHPGLKNGYRKLGKTIQTIGDLHAAQGTAEATTLADPLQYHSSDAFIVKETLTNRHILLRELFQAQQATRSKLSATDRLKASSSVRRDKVDEALAALEEAQSHESYLQHKTQRVTANLVHEKRKWFSRTSSDLRSSIREYVLREIEAERRSLAILEAVRPDIRAIDASGGLSRLGREATPAARRASLMSSQGPKGDAWSGVVRRPDSLSRSVSGSFILPGPVPPELEGGHEAEAGHARQASVGADGNLKVVPEDDEDRVDARNAASRLATSTF